MLLRGKIPDQVALKNLVQNIITSTSFLSFNGFYFVVMFCAIRQILNYDFFGSNEFTKNILPILARHSDVTIIIHLDSFPLGLQVFWPSSSRDNPEDRCWRLMSAML